MISYYQTCTDMPTQNHGTHVVKLKRQNYVETTLRRRFNVIMMVLLRHVSAEILT